MDPVEAALVAELARRSGLVWVTLGDPPRHHAVSHVWHDDAVWVVSGGGEQPLPGIDHVHDAVLTLRSRATRFTVARVRATVETVPADDARWDEAARVLLADRLNVAGPDPLRRWATSATVSRLVPVEVLEAPGRLGDGAQREEPVASPATTRTAGPWSLRRARKAPPPLSG
ncbi:hypothetical protein [Solicola sp. PLA-1-18]|uniref:hypothetical protein n=1 Tax=Solicola sp. PLA-1-18 TaxID=3380532 RepID=UPI003B772604